MGGMGSIGKKVTGSFKSDPNHLHRTGVVARI